VERNNESLNMILVFILKVSLMSSDNKNYLHSPKVEENVCFAHNCMSAVSLLFRSVIWGSANRDLELPKSVVSKPRTRTSKGLPVSLKGSVMLLSRPWGST
jgi:hypothetical protein